MHFNEFVLVCLVPVEPGKFDLVYENPDGSEVVEYAVTQGSQVYIDSSSVSISTVTNILLIKYFPDSLIGLADFFYPNTRKQTR